MTPQSNWFINRGFLLKIVLPVLLTLVLFIVALYQIVIPRFEEIVLDRKREMIRELTHSVWHIAERYHQEEFEGRMSREEAQRWTVEQVRNLRYGEEAKDYFWITDFQPRMIVHPFRPDLDGEDLTNFRDSEGKTLFVEIVSTVRARGEGYVDYTWQWKDDSTRVVPKLSYVKPFVQWEWIIGTGIYIEDVRAEIDELEGNIITISLLITLVIALLLVFITVQNLHSERRRLEAENDLLESKEKYQALVEATTEGLLMVLEGRQTFYNKTLLGMLGYTEAESRTILLQELFPPEVVDEIADTYDPEKIRRALSERTETQLRQKDGSYIDVLLTVSSITFIGKTGVVVIVKDMTPHRAAPEHHPEDVEGLLSELQAPMLLLEQPIRPFVKDFARCGMHESIAAVARMMSRTKTDVALVRDAGDHFVGLVSICDLQQGALVDGLSLDRPIYEIMRAPLLSLYQSASVFDLLARSHEKGQEYFAVKDLTGAVVGTVQAGDIEKSQLHSYIFFLHRLHAAESVSEVRHCHGRLMHYIYLLIGSGASVRTLTHATTMIAESVLRRLIALAIEELGPPPVSFTFLVLGSLGRSEPSLVTDQDNAILYDDDTGGQGEQVQKYFLLLGERVCDALHTMGYTHCKGDIMAKNEKWCRPLSDWKRYFTGWVGTAQPQDLLDVSIFFDFRCVYGDETLAEQLRDHVYKALSGNTSFFLHLSQNALRVKPPTRQLKSADSIDGKWAMLPVIDITRIYALKHRVRESNTVDRLARLQEQQIFSPSGHRDILQAYSYLMQLRFQHQSAAIAAGREANNDIAMDELTDAEKVMLRRLMSQIETFQTKLNLDFKGTM